MNYLRKKVDKSNLTLTDYLIIAGFALILAWEILGGWR